MCGILFIDTARPGHFAARQVERALERQAFRGPDAQALRELVPGATWMGHNRLAIVDPLPRSNQPFELEGGRWHIVFNGEIYNHAALRRRHRLAERMPLRTSSDTETLLAGYALMGEAFLDELEGMYAFVILDRESGDWIAARDPLGIKPLYVCRNPDANGEWSLLFASEIRAILASRLIGRPRLDPRALASILWNGFVAGTHTSVAGVELIPPGEIRVLDAKGTTLRARRYWHIGTNAGGRPISDEELKATITDSVKLHMISDVPLGIFLSGGIDSSAVANLAQRANRSPVHTFTLAFEEAKYDEGRFSREIAKGIGTEHREIMLTEQQFSSSLETAIDTLDQPTFDGLNSYFISKAVRDAGLTVALVGTGGDELFGGYPTFRTLPLMQRWARRGRIVPEWAKQFGASCVSRVLSGSARSAVPPQTRWAKLPDMVRSGEDLLASYQYAYGLFLPEFQERLLLNAGATSDMRYGLTNSLTADLESEMRGRSAIASVSVLEQRLFLGERLLRDTDAASMAVSLETRLPLVDSVVSDAVTRMSDHGRFDPLGRKQVLRRIGLEGLDPALFERPKQGFVMPFDRWIRRSLGDAMDSTMRDASLVRAVGLNDGVVSGLWSAFQSGAPGLYWSRVWTIYALIRWCHRHDVHL